MTRIFRTRRARAALGWWLFVALGGGLALTFLGWEGLKFVAILLVVLAAIFGTALLFAHWIDQGEET